MELQFTHKESEYGSNYLTIKEDSGIVISIGFDSDEAKDISIDGCAYRVSERILDSLYVSIFCEHFTLRNIVKQAEYAWPDIKREIEEDDRAQAEVNKYSSGR